MAVTDQVLEILRQVDEARQARQDHCVQLLSVLASSLQEAEFSGRERQQAPRFNSFKYLRDDEIGLSNVIADLLDPRVEHGHGTSFFEAMLEILPDQPGWLKRLHPLNADSIHVKQEHWIPEGGGRMDITVEISSATGRACIAFENKPYASDLDRQIESYLHYLHNQYQKHFLLIYLPPVYRWPAENSFPQAERDKWQEHFRIMPYIGADASLEKWLVTCQERCDADRVRSFLMDAQIFCQQQFGETPMSTNPDVLFVLDYLAANPSQLSAALAVHDAWVLVRDDVCKRFLEHLREAVNDRARDVLTDVASDCNVWCNYGGKKNYSNWLSISRDDWVQSDDMPGHLGECTQIRLESAGPGPNKWYLGVRSPKPIDKMSEEETRRRADLSIALQRHGLMPVHDSQWWPQWKWLRNHQDWPRSSLSLLRSVKRAVGG